MKIAILGASRTSRDLAPFDDPSWEIWACSAGTIGVPRIDLHFELHDLDVITGQSGYPDYLQHVPVMMQEKTDEFPYSSAYPKDEMVAEFGPHFFSSSIAFMLALAISKKPETIGLWGVDMLASDEYDYQRPGCFRFIEIARERGIEVYIPPQSGLLITPRLYGYDY